MDNFVGKYIVQYCRYGVHILYVEYCDMYWCKLGPHDLIQMIYVFILYESHNERIQYYFICVKHILCEDNNVYDRVYIETCQNKMSVAGGGGGGTGSRITRKENSLSQFTMKIKTFHVSRRRTHANSTMTCIKC